MGVILNVLEDYAPGSKSLNVTCCTVYISQSGRHSCSILNTIQLFWNLFFDSLALKYCNLTFAVLKKKSNGKS